MSTYPYRTTTDAISLLKKFARRNDTLRISRTFRGMLFTQELSLVSLGPDQAIFKGARSHLAASLGDRILLHSPGLGEVLEGEVIGLDIQLGRLILGELSLTGRAWADRCNDRVQPRRPIRVLLRCDKCSLPTTLENISMVGVGLMAYKVAERGIEPHIGHAVKVDLELPVVRGKLSLSGKLTNVVQHGSRLTCLGVNTFPNSEQARVLERFISQRKTEIVDELDDAFNASFEPRSVKELYF